MNPARSTAEVEALVEAEQAERRADRAGFTAGDDHPGPSRLFRNDQDSEDRGLLPYT
jgi:hypothetical protein